MHVIFVKTVQNQNKAHFELVGTQYLSPHFGVLFTQWHKQPRIELNTLSINFYVFFQPNIKPSKARTQKVTAIIKVT